MPKSYFNMPTYWLQLYEKKNPPVVKNGKKLFIGNVKSKLPPSSDSEVLR